MNATSAIVVLVVVGALGVGGYYAIKKISAATQTPSQLNQQGAAQGSTLDKVLASFAGGLGTGAAGSWFPSGYASGGGYNYDPTYTAPY